MLKYVLKGSDLAFVQVVKDNDNGTGTVTVDYDEFKEIHLARYQTPMEAMLSIWGHKLVRMSHQVKINLEQLP